jgi:hypothetical protein
MFARVVEQLEVTPEILRAMMGQLSDAEANWKPAPQRFSIAEVMAHLCDTETQVFRTRLERMVNEDNPPLDAYDQEAIAAAGGYAGRSVQATWQDFQKHRTANLTYPRSLPAAIGARLGRHPELGPITIAQLLNEWAFHDLKVSASPTALCYSFRNLSRSNALSPILLPPHRPSPKTSSRYTILSSTSPAAVSGVARITPISI